MEAFLNKLHYIFIEVHINEWYLNLLQTVFYALVLAGIVLLIIYVRFFISVIIKDLRLKTGEKK